MSSEQELSPLHQDVVAFLSESGLPITTKNLNLAMNHLAENPTLRKSYKPDTTVEDFARRASEEVPENERMYMLREQGFEQTNPEKPRLPQQPQRQKQKHQ
jgi:hypothetical protein